jgi:hypothetical protein
LCKANAFLLNIHAQAILLLTDGQDGEVNSFVFGHGALLADNSGRAYVL